MRRHLPLAPAGAAVAMIFTPLLPQQAARAQSRSHIQARARVVSAQQSWGAEASVRDMLNRAFRPERDAGSLMDVVMALKAAARSAPDGTGVFFEFDGGRSSLTGSSVWAAKPAPSSEAVMTLIADTRLRYDPQSLTKPVTKPSSPHRIVVYIHHPAN